MVAEDDPGTHDRDREHTGRAASQPPAPALQDYLQVDADEVLTCGVCRVELLLEVGLVHVGSPSVARVSSRSVTRSVARPRDEADLTAPTEMPRVSATSCSDRSQQWRRTTMTRCWRGSRDSSRSTSPRSSTLVSAGAGPSVKAFVENSLRTRRASSARRLTRMRRT